jgi:trypsin-like peptidase
MAVKRCGISILAFALLATLSLGAHGSDRLNPDLLSSVLRIETAPTANGNYEVGTGFLISTTGDLSGRTLLVTNKHVIGDWNYADRDIRTLHPWINVFFYRQGDDPSGQAYRPTKIDLLNSSGTLDTLRVYPHPAPNIDLVAIDVTDKINNHKDEHIRSTAYARSYLLAFGRIQDWQTDIADQVIALGYPLGIRSLRNDYPIAKMGYLASIPGQEVSIPTSSTNRAGANVATVIEGKFLVVDGLIVNGNSGGPVVLVGGVRVRRDPTTNQLQFSDKPIQNYVIGVVSYGLGGGLTAIVSSDYLFDLLDWASPKSAK